MKIFPFTLFFFLFIGCNNNDSNQNCVCFPVNKGNFPDIELYSELAWTEEFDGNQLNFDRWSLSPEGVYEDLNHQQHFSVGGENVLVEDGIMKLLLSESDSAGKKSYSTASLKTIQEFDYGRIDVRAKMPFGKGVLATICLKNEVSSEMISIVSFLGDKDKEIFSSVRYTDIDEHKKHQSESFFLDDGKGFSRGYHTFTIIREENAIWFYVDGQPYYHVDNTISLPSEYPFNNKKYNLYINLYTGGEWPGGPNEQTSFPQKIDLDYIKYYKTPKDIDIHANKVNTPSLSEYNRLSWSDEFDEMHYDSTVWTPEVGDFWYNNEIQAYTADSTNIFISNGKLVLQAMESPDHVKTVRDYTSARIITHGKKRFKNGRIDVKAKVPYGQGLWPAIWMMPETNKYGAWPRSGEIDILEVIGYEMDVVHKACHFGSNLDRHSRGRGYYHSNDLSEDFHVYSLIKEKDNLWWYFDSIPMLHVSKDLLAPHHYPFNEEFYLIMNIAVGGGWPGYPDETTKFPQTMEVEYVRLYEKE